MDVSREIATRITLRWPSRPENRFRVEESADLTDWTERAGDLPADAAESATEFEIQIAGDDSETFFRILLK